MLAFMISIGMVLTSYMVVCRKKQARRLLFDRSGSDEHERSILTKFKELLGGQFTSKMEGMVSFMSFISLKRVV